MKSMDIYKALEKQAPVSAWGKGVLEQALDMVEFVEVDLTLENVKEVLLNGARDWKEYVYGGGGLVYDYLICDRYCTESEKKKKRHGQLPPNSRESWLDLEARAVGQAYTLIRGILLRNQ